MAKKEMIKNGEDISLDDGNVLVLNGVSVAEKSTEVKKELEAEKEPEEVKKTDPIVVNEKPKEEIKKEDQTLSNPIIPTIPVSDVQPEVSLVKPAPIEFPEVNLSGNAKINEQINGISNEDFFVGDAGSGAQKLLKNHIKPDVVIVDPPRKGCSKETLNAVVQMNPDRIVYVSCDPATLARDCKYLEDNYELVKIQPVDMFPGTVHVETVVLMSRKDK